ncbi:MFS transporter [Actinomadura parmotrematis]|uniref:MFS transporter n=1 Tax=Actinomadura parmotrematis TaxID=2864039 RepID=A0ABS7FSX5_9ACTN|nr:MFS transporter [Actinomadura parmotrematis]MBW8482844.1 MFS transporter [Actinomadura parmotrematis]
MTQTTEAPPAGARRAPAPRPGAALLAVILLGQFMAILDTNIVNVALPTLRADLRASGAALQLIVAGYVAAYAVLLVTGARLGDLLGHRRMFLAGLAAFTAASLACGLAPGTGSLIAFRLAQGAAAALLTPQVMSMIQLGFADGARARALGYHAAVIAGGVVVGQVAGGLLVSADLFGTGWRSVFLVNVPIGLALLAVAPRVLPDGERRRDGGVDLPGLLLLTPAVLLFVLPLILGRELGWPAWTWASLAASAVLAPVFAVVERRVAARGGRPLLNLALLRVPGLAQAALGTALGPFVWGAYLFTTTLHLQGDLRYGALESGLAFVPAVAAFALIGLNWRRLPARWHGRLVPLGFATAGAALLALGPLAGGGALYEALTAVIGLGLGAMPIAMTAALHRVPVRDASDGSGLLLTLMQLGSVVGVAAVGTLFLELAGDGGSTRHAEYGTGWALGGLAIAAAAMTLPRARRARD